MPKPLVYGMMVMIFLVVAGLWFTHSNEMGRTSSPGPINIKANEELGIRLGMDVSEYKHRSVCHKEDANEEIFCSTDVPRKLTIGDCPVELCYLSFYKHKLIEISYTVDANFSNDSFLKAFIEKFGQPSRLTFGEDVQWQWHNATSSMRMYFLKGDLAHLTIQLDPEEAELWKRTKENKDVKARHDL